MWTRNDAFCWLRVLLVNILRIFDPIRFLSAILLEAKLLLRESWCGSRSVGMILCLRNKGTVKAHFFVIVTLVLLRGGIWKKPLATGGSGWFANSSFLTELLWHLEHLPTFVGNWQLEVSVRAGWLWQSVMLLQRPLCQSQVYGVKWCSHWKSYTEHHHQRDAHEVWEGLSNRW